MGTGGGDQAQRKVALVTSLTLMLIGPGEKSTCPLQREIMHIRLNELLRWARGRFRSIRHTETDANNTRRMGLKYHQPHFGAFLL